MRTPPNPSRLISMATSYWESATLMAAVRLHLFDALTSPKSIEEISTTIGSDPIATESLLIALISLDLIQRQDHLYVNQSLTQTFLTSDSPQSIAAALLYNADVYPLWGQLHTVIEKGDTQKDPQAYLGEDEGRTRRFVYGMHHRALGIGQAVGQVINFEESTLLADLGGGPGTYSALITQKTPGLKAHVLDLKGVVKVSQGIMKEMNASDQVRCLAYDYYTDELPDFPYDAALISGVLHREQPAQVQKIFQSLAHRLPKGGRLWISDVMLNDERTGPIFSAMFALNMRVLAHDGRCHSVAEQSQWLQDAGFEICSTHQLDAPIHYTLIEARRL
jgi:hypothetical protein